MNTSYGSSKFALEAMSDCLRMEVADHGVSVSIVEPGFIKSDILTKAQAIQDPAQVALECRRLYGHLYTFKATQAIFDKAGDPGLVCRAVLHALTSPHPKTRYLVSNVNGVPCTWLAAFAWLAPDRLLDRILTPKLRADHCNFDGVSEKEALEEGVAK